MNMTVAGTAPHPQTIAEWRPRQKPSFCEVYETVKTAAYGTWDTLVDPSELGMREGRLVVSPTDGCEQRSLGVLPWAMGQLCHRLGIPVAYFRRCPADLQDVQVNRWLGQFVCDRSGPEGLLSGRSRQASETRWLLRAQNERLRAVLTDRYAPIDNALVVEHLKPIIGDRYYADWFAMDDESLHLRLFDPAMRCSVSKDDPIMAGIHVSNSEVGKRSVTVDALIYREVCSNGMIALVRGKSLMHRRHVGVQNQDFGAELRLAVLEASEQARTMLEQFAATTRQPVTDVEKTLERLGISWDLGKSTQELIKDALQREAPSHQETLYGVINAITNAAQRLQMDERYQLERLAGGLMQKGLPSPSLVRREV